MNELCVLHKDRNTMLDILCGIVYCACSEATKYVCYMLDCSLLCDCKMENMILYQFLGVCKLIQNNCNYNWNIY